MIKFNIKIRACNFSKRGPKRVRRYGKRCDFLLKGDILKNLPEAGRVPRERGHFFSSVIKLGGDPPQQYYPRLAPWKSGHVMSSSAIITC